LAEGLYPPLGLHTEVPTVVGQWQPGEVDFVGYQARPSQTDAQERYPSTSTRTT